MYILGLFAYITYNSLVDYPTGRTTHYFTKKGTKAKSLHNSEYRVEVRSKSKRSGSGSIHFAHRQATGGPDLSDSYCPDTWSKGATRKS